MKLMADLSLRSRVINSPTLVTPSLQFNGMFTPMPTVLEGYQFTILENYGFHR